jgi:hypothetical protein
MTERTFEISGALDRIKVTKITQCSRSDCELVAQSRESEPDATLRGAERDMSRQRYARC